MRDWDEHAEAIRRDWNRQTEAGRIYTRPWLDISEERLRQYVRGETEGLEPEFNYIYPPAALHDVEGKRVLCLAAGGGQQSAVFGLLGADVTVVDISDAMLEGDQRAAHHYRYAVRTVQADMHDLRMFADSAFDRVYHAISLCYAPEVQPVYREVFRVLKPGVLYRVGHVRPATYRVEWGSWDGEGYCIASPYLGGRIAESDPGAPEYRHLLSSIFNGLVECGFVIRGVYEDPRHLDHSHAIESARMLRRRASSQGQFAGSGCYAMPGVFGCARLLQSPKYGSRSTVTGLLRNDGRVVVFAREGVVIQTVVS